MPNILFNNTDRNNNLTWCINTGTGFQSGILKGGSKSEPLPSNALSIGWQSDAGQIWTYWGPSWGNYAYLVYSQPYSSSAFVIPTDHSSGEMTDTAAEGAAAGMVQWKNNSKNNAEWWMYANGGSSGGAVNAGTAGPPTPLPTAGPVFFGWKVKSFKGRLLLNLKPPSGLAFQLVLENY